MALYTIRVTDNAGNVSSIQLSIVVKASPIPVPLYNPVLKNDALIIDRSNSIDGLGEITPALIIDNSSSIEPIISNFIDLDNSTTTSETGSGGGGSGGSGGTGGGS